MLLSVARFKKVSKMRGVYLEVSMVRVKKMRSNKVQCSSSYSNLVLNTQKSKSFSFNDERDLCLLCEGVYQLNDGQPVHCL